jgi:predicted metal-dependent hydrolase
MQFDWTQGSLAEGLHLYNTAQFFAAHEAWEAVWLHAPHPEKRFLQALIQITAAMHHCQRSNNLGATRLLTAALAKLEPYPDDFGSIDLLLLRNDLRTQLDTLAGKPAPSQITPPRIQPSRIIPSFQTR